MNNYNPFSLEDKIILITGASSGIGRSTAIECSKMGAKVIITARNKERLTDTYNHLEGEGHQMIVCDLSSLENIKSLVSELPKIDGLVNNAGFTKLAPVQFINFDDFGGILQVNLLAPIYLFQQCLKTKKLGKNSSVVFTSSTAGLGSTTVGNGMYTASKGAISTFIRTAAKELASKNIRVNAVCPAMVNTGILDSGALTPEQMEANKKKYPMGRWAEPEEVAWGIIYLLSNASSFVSGSNLIIDGAAK